MNLKYAIVNYPIPEEILKSGLIAQTNVTARVNNSKSKCIVSYEDSFPVIFRGYPTLPEDELHDFILNNPEEWDGDYEKPLITQPIDFINKSAIQDAIPVVNYKPEEESFSRATHDFTNKCTWLTNSIRVEDEVLTTSDSLTYTMGNSFIIDVVSGAVNRQDLYQSTHNVIVKVDDVVVTDYTIDCRDGSITFPGVQSGVIKCTYSYATNSEWVIGPKEGKILIIEHSEVQFAKDVQINTPLRFEIWVGNPYFAVPGHPYEGMPKIPYQNIQYNSVRDLINEANLGTGYIPMMGDLPDDILVFPFNYVSVKPFRSSLGAELRIKSVDDVELTGSYGTATFYLITRSES